MLGMNAATAPNPARRGWRGNLCEGAGLVVAVSLGPNVFDFEPKLMHFVAELIAPVIVKECEKKVHQRQGGDGYGLDSGGEHALDEIDPGDDAVVSLGRLALGIRQRVYEVAAAPDGGNTLPQAGT